jgi:hypothetical protein
MDQDSIIAARLNDLNREMMRLPIDERRKRWEEYYRRLDHIARRHLTPDQRAAQSGLGLD